MSISRERLLVIVLTLAVLLLIVGSVLADDAVGRPVTQDDWTARMPIVILSVVIAIGGDLLFIIPIYRRSRRAAERDGS